MDEEKEVEVILDAPKEPEHADKQDPVVIVEGDDLTSAAQEDVTDPKIALKKMEEKLEKAKKKAEKFEREKEIAQQYAQQAKQEAGESRKHVMLAALNQTRMDAERLQAEFADAMSISDYSQVAKIQAEISANSLRMAQFEAEVDAFKRQDSSPQQQISQIDQIIKSVSRDSADWLKKHRESLSDDRMIRKMFRAHEDAVEDGIKPDTDEYFEFIESRLGLEQKQQKAQTKREIADDDDDEPTSRAAKPSQRQVPPSPAPVERYSTRPNVIRLSRVEAETAKMLGMTEKEYAMHKIALQKEGKLPH